MAVENDMNVFTSELDILPDVAKNYLWEAVIIPEEGTPLASLFKKLGGTRQFTIRCKSSALPGRSIESEHESHWQGSKKVSPGRTKMDGEVTLKFDEYQDWVTSHMLESWFTLMHNNNIHMDGGSSSTYFDQKTGAAVSNYMRDYSAKIRMTSLDSRLNHSSSHDYIYYYCWPKDMPQVSMDQEGSDKIQREVTIRYSTYEEVDPEGSRE